MATTVYRFSCVPFKGEVLGQVFHLVMMCFLLMTLIFYHHPLLAQPYISMDTPPSCYEIEGRVRNGANEYEGALFSPSTPGPQSPGGSKWKMDPVGKPAWNSNGNHYGDTHTFRFTYTPSTATTVWSIDFNRDKDYEDPRETIVNIAPTHLGKGFQYINVFGQGYAGASVKLSDLILNGVYFGSFSSSTNTPFTTLFEDSTGMFRDIVITGTFSITGYNLSERPRIWIQLGESNIGPPTCVLTSPEDGSIYAPGSPVKLTATATDYLGKVVKVEFFDGADKIGEDLTAPFVFDYLNAPYGIRTLHAKAIDNHQAFAYSNIVTVFINAIPLIVITSPHDGAVYFDPDVVSIEASLLGISGTIHKVEFFIDDVYVGMDSIAPYSIKMLNIPIGYHSTKAKTNDSQGHPFVSSIVHFTAKCIREDVNIDGTVSTMDFLEVLSTFGMDCNLCPSEFTDDGIVDTFDYLRILARFGFTCN